METIMNQPTSSQHARAERQVNIDPFLLEMNRVSHSSNAIELRVLRKRAKVKKHKKKLRSIGDRLKKLFKEKKTSEGELFLARMELNVLQEGLKNGNDSD